MIRKQPIIAVNGSTSLRKKYPMITVKGALAVNKIAFRRGPSRFNVANKRVSPRTTPM